MLDDEHAERASIPHERIRDVQDRAWTVRLLAVAFDTSVERDERLDALETLAELGDPRAVGPLTQLLEDVTVADDLREAAADGVSIDTTPEQRAAWWESGDDVLMAHAVSLMERGEGELVAEIAGDDTHPLQADALRALSRDFDEPQFHQLLIDALGHHDDEVRLQAARTLLWDEPVAAQDALVTAANDPDEELAYAALQTLGYYPSRRVLRTLADLSETHRDAGVRGAAQGTLESLATHEFAWALQHLQGQPVAIAHLRRWLEPVDDLVERDAPPAERTAASTLGASERTRPHLRPAAPEVLAALGDPDRAWRPLEDWLFAIDWSAFEGPERSHLRQAFLEHPDREMRAIAAVPLHTWSDTAGLLRLASDPSRSVRKSAVFGLGELEPDPLLADVLWDAMLVATGMPASEALTAYAKHAPPPESSERLVRLAREDRRADVRLASIVSLESLGCSEEIASLADLLYAGPYVNWSLHSWLIDAIAKLGLPSPNLEHLLDVDDLNLQLSIARLLARDALG